MPKVSVIIPIFGVEKYIDRCARSLFEQTLDDIEYIFVDDCSTDNSIAILTEVVEQYPSRKSDIRIIHMPTNSGQAKVREVGIKASTGDYIIHCDSDDWVNVTMYEKMWQKAVDKKADMVICGFYKIFDEKGQESYFQKEFKNPLAALIADRITGFTCTKLVKRDLFRNEIIQPSGNLLEDTLLTIQLAYYCKKFAFVSEPLYYYYQNNASICATSLSEDKFLGAKSNLESTFNFLLDKGLYDRYSKEINYLKVRITRLSTLLSDELFRKYNKHIDWNLLLSKYCPAKEKLGYLTKLLGIHGISRIFKK